MAPPRLDRAFVQRWSRAYVDGQTEAGVTTEAWLFTEVGAQARRRGYLTSDGSSSRSGEWEVASSPVRLPEAILPDPVDLVTRRALRPLTSASPS